MNGGFHYVLHVKAMYRNIYVFMCIFAYAIWASANDKVISQASEGKLSSLSHITNDEIYTNHSLPIETWNNQNERQQLHELYQHSATLHRGDIIELQDVPTSNIWVGPQSGTTGIKWACITSDASGLNLAAGSFSPGTLLCLVTILFFLVKR